MKWKSRKFEKSIRKQNCLLFGESRQRNKKCRKLRSPNRKWIELVGFFQIFSSWRATTSSIVYVHCMYTRVGKPKFFSVVAFESLHFGTQFKMAPWLCNEIDYLPLLLIEKKSSDTQTCLLAYICVCWKLFAKKKTMNERFFRRIVKK